MFELISVYLMGVLANIAMFQAFLDEKGGLNAVFGEQSKRAIFYIVLFCSLSWIMIWLYFANHFIRIVRSKI